jgi:signal transduction histidine kinase
MTVGPKRFSAAHAYAFALALTAVAVMARWLVDPWLGNGAPLITLYGAVAAAIAYGGLGPAVVTATTGYLACDFAFIEPRRSVIIQDAYAAERLGLYLVSCSVIIGVGYALRVARHHAETNWRCALGKQKQLEVEVARRTLAEEALREADRRKDEFLAVLAHELRNPLAAAQYALHLLQDAGENRKVANEAHAALQRQMSYMTRLADDLLDIERIANGKVDLQRQPTELTALCRDAVEATTPMMRHMAQELTVVVAAESIYVDVDLVRMTQVLWNLLANAAKYTPHGGHIRLTAERAGSDAVITVKDDGMGIPEDMLRRVFDVFTQVHMASERSQGGLGLGLALARQLTELHGGRIEARSDGAGKGSEFSVRLPIAQACRKVSPPELQDQMRSPDATLSCS